MLTRNTQRAPGWSETFTGEPRNIPPVAVETTARIELPISYGRSLPPMPHQIPNTRRKRPTERTRHLGHFGDRTKRNRPHPPIRKNWCSRCAVSHSTQMVALGRPHANGSMCRLATRLSNERMMHKSLGVVLCSLQPRAFTHTHTPQGQ